MVTAVGKRITFSPEHFLYLGRTVAQDCDLASWDSTDLWRERFAA
jgi:hypothetical protein